MYGLTTKNRILVLGGGVATVHHLERLLRRQTGVEAEAKPEFAVVGNLSVRAPIETTSLAAS